MADFDDDMLAFAEGLAKRTAERHQRLRQLGLTRQEQLRFDEEEQVKREQKQQQQQQMEKNQPQSPSKAHLISFSKQLHSQNENRPSTTTITSVVGSPLKNFAALPSSPLPSLALGKVESNIGSPLKTENRMLALSPSKLESLSPIKSQAPSPLRPRNLAVQPPPSSSSTIKPAVFTPPKVEFRSQVKTVEFSPLLGQQNRSPIRPVNFSPTTKVGSPSITSSLSTYNLSPKPYGQVSNCSVKKELFGKHALEQMECDDKNLESISKPAITGTVEKFSNSIEPDASTGSKIQQLRSTFDRKPSELATSSTTTPSILTPNKLLIKKSVQTNSLVKNRARQFEVNEQQTPEMTKPPERLCVSDKKKLFESAIKRETENAKRNHEQQMFLARAKYPNLRMSEEAEGEEEEEHEFDVKKRKENEFEFMKEEAREIQIESGDHDGGHDQQQVNDMQQNTESAFSQQFVEAESVAQLLNDQDMDTQPAVVTNCQESTSSIVSIPPPMPIISGYKENVDLPEIDQEEVKKEEEEEKEEEQNWEKFDIEQRKQLLHQQLFEPIYSTISSPTINSQAPSPIKQRNSPQVSPVKTLQQSSPRKAPLPELYPQLPKLTGDGETLNDQHLLASVQENIQKLHELSKQCKPMTPIPRTLSMFRREQKARAAQNMTPSRAVRHSEDEVVDKQLLCQMWIKQTQDKIAFLKDEIKKHKATLTQSCNAVNLCLKKEQFHGTLQQLDSERVYLITEQKRLACENEVKRLNKLLVECKNLTEPLPEMLIKPPAVGRITIHYLNIPLKSDFIVSQVSGEDAYDHHYFCIMRSGAQVLYTDTLNSGEFIQQGSLCFKPKLFSKTKQGHQQDHPFVFNDLDNQFELHVEVFGMALKHVGKSLLPESFKKIAPRSPRKNKKNVYACRYDYTTKYTFTRLARLTFTKNNITSNSKHDFDLLEECPLYGHMEMKCEMEVAYQIEMSDYLNFYDDGGEYPIWSRRWCVLKGYHLAYWRFREDQTNKPSMGVIDLRQCVSPQVVAASYEECARQNTFLMICVQAKQDYEVAEGLQAMSPVKSQLHKTMVIKKYLISADLKDEMDAWCKNLNQLLESVRIWEKDCLQPYESRQLDRLIRH